MTSFKPKEVVKILRKLGFTEKRQKGSHLIMYNPNSNITIPVPMHSKDLKKGLLKGIIKDAESTEKEFLKLK
ncbi:hypothetical protein A3A75_00965 [Candidatus Woesebacteria bacterium RIFCSPLOWO2_01_FULL_39_10]|uniref:Toxin HicA n=1 Tax=Candidatus Woesebacteria bacterium RIFCSPLOWO2_01_FULL_39_10 TaxID=1802516 RepID=A0A1F8B7L6_9BACT|nr:MAG: hypothetical protein A3A75_00965 [Candidatus Woesebacteria bacterium RIFCSPLOWO2_01_FULL_39_10]